MIVNNKKGGEKIQTHTKTKTPRNLYYLLMFFKEIKTGKS